VANRKQQRIDPNKIEKIQVPAKLDPQTRIETDAKVRPVPPRAGRSGRPGGRPPSAPKIKKAGAREWIGGARLRTLPLSIAPVLLGTAAAHVTKEPWLWWNAGLALAVAVLLQIGVNYANDYSDGIRGTDKYRVGPSRLTGSGAAKPRAVLTVALTFLVLAAAAGVGLVVITGQYWLLAVGAACLVAGFFYTGGKRPYGYYGLGELFVFVFFGLVATAGTTYVQLKMVNFESWLSGICVGLIACAVLLVNNLRDRPQDKLAGKRTLAVLIGDRASRVVFTVFMLLPFLLITYFVITQADAYLTYLVLFLALPACLITITAKTPKELVLSLQLASFTALAFAIVLGFSLVV
jgi:1,4-dihydroxy-2-naphthoate octaprenyltransferase